MAPPRQPPPPRGLDKLPSEILLQLANNLSQHDLDSFLRADPRNQSLNKLKNLTIGTRAFAPWRRRWEHFTRAQAAALNEARDRAWQAEFSNNPYGANTSPEAPSSTAASTIVASTQIHRAGNKGERELQYEATTQDMFSSYGFAPPAASPGGSTKRMRPAPMPPRFPVVNEGLVFEALGRVFAHTSDRGFLKLKPLGCSVARLVMELEKATGASAGMVQRMCGPHNLKHGGETEQSYRLATAYLLYTSLTPAQLPGVVARATDRERRDTVCDERERAVMEYVCFLGVWMELWEAQTGMLRYPKGFVPAAGILTDQDRRVLLGRLKEFLQGSFAPAKPIVGEAAPASQTMPASQGRMATMGYGNRTRSAGILWTEMDDTQPRYSWASQPSPVVQQTQSVHLTVEQQSVVDSNVGPGELMKVRAYAGTGKTRSLVEYAKRRPKTKFLYVAFNKSAELDARKRFGPNVDCKTVHALALGVLRFVAPNVAAAKAACTMPICQYWGNKDVTDLLQLDNEKVISNALKNPNGHQKPGQRKKRTTAESALAANPNFEPTQESTKKPWPTATSVATTVRLTLESFWHSADREVTGKALPIATIENLGLKPTAVLGWARAIWQDTLDARAPWLPHDAYLKLLQVLGETTEGDQRAFGQYNTIMFDEAQDANLCMTSIILRQQARGAALIVVGDPYQRIYGFRGAGNEAFDDARFPATSTHYLTWSFRFGDEVAGVANIFLSALGEKVPVHGARRVDSVHAAAPLSRPSVQEMEIDSPPTAPFTVIFRKNITLIEYAITFVILHPHHKLQLRIQRSFGKQTLFSTLRDAYYLLHDSRRALKGQLKPWKSWDDLKAHVEATTSDATAVPDSPILALLVQLEPRLLDPNFLSHLAAVEANVLDDDVDGADVVLITAHQAKGLEWDRVMVADDFRPEYSRRNRISRAKFWRDEAGIAYVAVTRARKQLLLSHPLTAWLAAERGWRRTYLEMQQPATEPACGFCFERGSVPREPLAHVLICYEEVVGTAGLVDGARRGEGGTVMCVACAKATLEANSGLGRVVGGEGEVVAALVRAVTGEAGRARMAEVVWAEREAWDAVWRAWVAAETERVEGWVGGCGWDVWLDARDGMV